MERKLALIDIDNTLNLFDATCVVVAHNLLEKKVPEVFDCWDEALSMLPAEERALVFQEAHTMHYINLTGPLGGSVEALHEIAKDYDVLYLSDRRSSAHEDTVAWLTNSGYPSPKNLVCSPDKRTLMQDLSDDDMVAFIVDDRPRTLVFALHELNLDNVFSLRYRYNENLSDIPGIHLSDTWDGILADYKRFILGES